MNKAVRTWMDTVSNSVSRFLAIATRLLGGSVSSFFARLLPIFLLGLLIGAILVGISLVPGVFRKTISQRVALAVNC